MEKIKSGYTIQGIHLVKSNFERPKYIPKDQLKNIIDLTINSEAKNDNIICELTTDFKILDQKEEVAVKLGVTFRGVFQKVGETKLEIDYFANVNAPAIMYPFVREHITNISLKCGYNAVFLPPYNFQHFYHERLAKKSVKKDDTED